MLVGSLRKSNDVSVMHAITYSCADIETGIGNTTYTLDSTVLSSCYGGTYTVYTVFDDPTELYGNSQAVVTITITADPSCVSFTV